MFGLDDFLWMSIQDLQSLNESFLVRFGLANLLIDAGGIQYAIAQFVFFRTINHKSALNFFLFLFFFSKPRQRERQPLQSFFNAMQE